MTKQLVLVHGRAQQGKDPGALKAEWLAALHRGFDKIGRQLPVAESDVRFPFYGDMLDQMSRGVPAESAAAVIQRGPSGDDAEMQFIREVFAEVQRRAGITDDEVAAVADADVVERGALNWGWTQAIMRAVDRRLPGGSVASIMLVTRDVHSYLRNPALRARLEEGVAAALSDDRDTVVVAHSLGSVVAYNQLRRGGRGPVALFLTVGSPLGVTAIRSALKAIEPVGWPQHVSQWANARDERDFVALYPLTPDHFPLSTTTPAINNYSEVDNHTSNRHGIEGYLDDPFVARAIHDALA
jgi:hypothetical protein